MYPQHILTHEIIIILLQHQIVKKQITYYTFLLYIYIFFLDIQKIPKLSFWLFIISVHKSPTNFKGQHLPFNHVIKKSENFGYNPNISHNAHD
jgi:hypothetical protein